MSSSKAVIAAVFALSVPAAFAQEPGVHDDVNATMRTIGDPNADKPDDILRAIPTPKPKRAAKSTDSIGKDLASPGKDEADDAGGDAGTAEPQTPSDPVQQTPVDTGHGGSGEAPDVPVGNGPEVGAPDPRDRADGVGHQVSEEARNHGEDVRRHHDAPPTPKPPHDKPPRGPGSKPPSPAPPAAPPSDPKHPGPRMPHPRPPDTHPPRNPQPPGPRNPGPRPPDVRPPAPHPPGTPPPRPPRPG